MKSMMKNSVFALALAVSGSVFSVQASAASAEPSAWVGGLFGLSIPNSENTTSRPMFGITGGAKLGSEWGVGAYFTTSQKDETAGTTTAKFGYDLYGIELAYHFEGEARGVYLGGRLGTSKVTAASLTTSPAHYGAMVGYNHFINDNFSLGGEASFVSVAESSGTPSGATQSTTIKGFTTVNFLASAKVWF